MCSFPHGNSYIQQIMLDTVDELFSSLLLQHPADYVGPSKCAVFLMVTATSSRLCLDTVDV